ncbi:hypothetical protein ANACOL_03510 [Anaerotruncus colihominis DSM 17241]|uniref:Uncharacterized protein n=1 Tax=Anaerotruncus colihominis DSM 17241 TaxID=445972 RepID=B0PFD0_9FIRM|nr:hypothetical protein ANACOL_03510 [Anaerotruncus colihominis DSM 17241]
MKESPMDPHRAFSMSRNSTRCWRATRNYCGSQVRLVHLFSRQSHPSSYKTVRRAVLRFNVFLSGTCPDKNGFLQQQRIDAFSIIF